MSLTAEQWPPYTALMSRHGRLVLGIVLVAAMADPRCCNATGDASAKEQARATVQEACCTAGTTVAAYQSCASDLLSQLIRTGALRARSASQVRKCLRRSACGRAGYATCCRARNGRTVCRIRKPADCLARGGCVGVHPTCCDACGPGGCATTTSSSSPTSSSTTTSLTTSTPICGNGIVESGEQCDGQAGCGSDCAVHLQICCEWDNVCYDLDSTVPGQGHFFAKFCATAPLEGAIFGATCAPVSGPCPQPPPDIPQHSCGFCEMRPFEPLTMCCQSAGPCTQESLTTPDALFVFGETCLFAQGNAVLGTCGGDGHCVPAP